MQPQTTTHAEAFPGITEDDFTSAGFHWHRGLNAYRNELGKHGDYWLFCFMAPAPGCPATAALILEETCFFEMEVRTPAGLTAATARALACIAEQVAECEAEDLQAFLDRQGLGHLFE